jgi:hypothetical protein
MLPIPVSYFTLFDKVREVELRGMKEEAVLQDYSWLHNLPNLRKLVLHPALDLLVDARHSDRYTVLRSNSYHRYQISVIPQSATDSIESFYSVIGQLTRLESLGCSVEVRPEWSISDDAAISLAKTNQKCHEKLSQLGNLTQLSITRLDPSIRAFFPSYPLFILYLCAKSRILAL